MKLNKEWHSAHTMPKNPTMEQRIIWHLEHKKNCGCRDIPEKVREAIKRKGIKV